MYCVNTRALSLVGTSLSSSIEALELPGASGERPRLVHHHLRVVAHLLQLAEHREHRAATPEAVLVRLDARQPRVDDLLVEHRLLRVSRQ